MTLSTDEIAELFQCLFEDICKVKSWFLVETMLSVHPKLIEMVDKDNRTLLHNACNCIPLQPDVVQFLVRQHPAKMLDLNKCTPLHLVCYDSAPSLAVLQLLLETYPDTVSMKDSNGDFPLLLTIYGHASSEVICYLAKKWPAACLLLSGLFEPLESSVRKKRKKKTRKDVGDCLNTAFKVLKWEIRAASCALIDAILHSAASVPWPVVLHVAEVVSDIASINQKNEGILSELAIKKFKMASIQKLLDDNDLQAWLTDIQHQKLVDGFVKMNSAGRSFLINDRHNKLKDIAVLASVTKNTECLFLYLRSKKQSRFSVPAFRKTRDD